MGQFPMTYCFSFLIINTPTHLTNGELPPRPSLPTTTQPGRLTCLLVDLIEHGRTVDQTDAVEEPGSQPRYQVQGPGGGDERSPRRVAQGLPDSVPVDHDGALRKTHNPECGGH